MLIIGGQLSGYFSANESKKRLYVKVIGAKEFFECTPVVLCANVEPVHLDTSLAYVKDFLDERLAEDVPSPIAQYRDCSLREPD